MPVVRGFPRIFPVNGTYVRRPRRYALVSGAFRLAFRSMFGGGLTIEGEENIPREGGSFLCSNHLANIDSLVLGAFARETYFVLGKAELFRFAPIGWVLAGCNVIPVDRGTADRRALRLAIEVVQRRGRLLVFVEGTRSRRPGMLRAEPGIGFLVRRAGNPQVVPMALWGTEEVRLRGLLKRTTRVHLRYGPPCSPLDELGPHASKQDIADFVARRIALLLPPGYRGVYGESATASGESRT